MPFPLTFLVEKNCACPTYRNLPLVDIYPYIMQSSGLKTQALKRFYRPLITLPKKLFSFPSNLSHTAGAKARSVFDR